MVMMIISHANDALVGASSTVWDTPDAGSLACGSAHPWKRYRRPPAPRSDLTTGLVARRGQQQRSMARIPVCSHPCAALVLRGVGVGSGERGAGSGERAQMSSSLLQVPEAPFARIVLCCVGQGRERVCASPRFTATSSLLFRRRPRCAPPECVPGDSDITASPPHARRAVRSRVRVRAASRTPSASQGHQDKVSTQRDERLWMRCRRALECAQSQFDL
ncbi:hypothetical protein B0H14DRAFT_2562097 [Mycena olivaceomarginata]|nr:hypothetical protein B0H14DRAFT_2562097 [Mycena olivaceomarginata]